MAMLPKLAPTQTSAQGVVRRIHDALIADNARSQSERGAWGLSQLGACERNLWGAHRGVPSERVLPPRILAIFRHGDAIEAHVVSLLRQAGFEVQDVDPGTGEQWEVLTSDGVTGHADGIIELGDVFSPRQALLEIKSAKCSKFDELESLGDYAAWSPGYGAQIQAYMGLLGLHEALVVVYSKDDSRLYVEIIQADPEQFGELMAKATRVVRGELPERPTQATSRYCAFCKYCNRGDWCWGPMPGVAFDD